MITIFTPTYNRANTLPRLYESLVSQQSHDFEWLIVDDGSADNTKELIESLIAEEKIRIRYFFQENAGKHIAINTGLKNAEGQWFFTLDSDDYLRENAIEKMYEILQTLPTEFAGFTVIHFANNIKFDPEKFGTQTWDNRISYLWPHHGEMGYILKTDIARQYPFPVFKGEKFCQESLVFRRISKRNKILYTDNVLIGGDYLEDGLSKNFWQRVKESPRYSMLNLAERLGEEEISMEEKKQYAKMYWDIALQAKHISWFEKFAGIPFTYSMQYWIKRIFKV